METNIRVELTAEREWKLHLPEDYQSERLPLQIRELPHFRLGADGKPRLPATEENLEILRARLSNLLTGDPSVQLIDLLKLLEKRDYNISTRRLYLHYNRKFLLLTGLTPDTVSARDLQAYLLGFASRAVSRATQGLMHSALRFYYESVRGRNFFQDIGRPRPDPRRPLIISPEQVERIVQAGETKMYRAILELIYSGGLRAGEAAALRMHDILRFDGLIRVSAMAGRPERFTPLTRPALIALDEYLDGERRPTEPDQFLFPAPRGAGALSPRSIERAFHRAREKARVERVHGVHTLRHAFAAHALARGEERAKVAAWLGFKTVRSLRPYLS